MSPLLRGKLGGGGGYFRHALMAPFLIITAVYVCDVLCCN